MKGESCAGADRESAAPGAGDHDPPWATAGASLRAATASRWPRELLLRLVDRLTLVTVSLGTLAVGASAVRGIRGNLPSLSWTHGGLLLVAVLLLLMRRRLSYTLVLGGLAALVLLNGVTNLLHLGLASAGLMVLVAGAVMVTVAFGARAGMATVVASVLLLAAVGAAVVYGALPLDRPPPHYLGRPATWLSQAAAFALYAGIIVAYVGAVQQGLARALERLAGHAGALEATNSELQRTLTSCARAEQELRASETKYRLLAEQLDDVLFVQDMEGHTTYISQSVERVFGYTVAQACALQMPEMFAPESARQAARDFARDMALVREGHVPDRPLLQYEYRRADGSSFPGELRVRFIFDQDGRPAGVQGLLRDVSDRVRMEREKAELEEQLRQSEKLQAIGELAGGVAHDFNNQLTGVMGSAELLAMELTDRPDLTPLVEQITRSAQRAADLTAKLLAFSRRGKYRSLPMDLSALVQEVVDIFGRSIARAIRIELQLSAQRLLVRGDPSQLQSAVLNVALNARDALDGEGEIRIRTLERRQQRAETLSTGMSLAPGSYAVLEIADTGAGIRRQDRERLFQPFFTTKDAAHGTGMGLAATYGTLKAHGGAIEVDSQPGQGSTFTLLLPLCTEAELAEARASAEPEASPEPGVGHEPGTSPAPSRPAHEPPSPTAAELRFRELTALVVEDEAGVRATFGKQLTRLGLRHAFCERGDEAMEQLRQSELPFGLVLLDMNLPGKSGREVFAVLRRHHPRLPVVICTGHGQEQDLHQVLERPAVALLRKPFSLPQLRQALERVLQDRR